MARVDASIAPAERDVSRTAISVGAVIAALYFGREIFVPIALAILLSFVLAPAVRRLNSLGVGRVLPVLLTTSLAFCVVIGLGGVLAVQIRTIAGDVPQYEETVGAKIASIKGLASGKALTGLEDIVHRFESLTAADRDRPPAMSAQPGPSPAAPIPVEVRQPASSPIEAANAVLAPLLHPLAMGGIVVIFTLFILLQREDLRNRLIRLFGASDLQHTTEAINDGAHRLSRYLLTQLLINASGGLTVGVAMALIGVPNPTLWGILFGCMRFVPYLGPIIGGALPCLFAAAVAPGWTMALWALGLIVLIEIAVGQFLEPMLYGHHTGLSPVAVVVAATFWTVLWGPVGLLLSTPLTVCLVVIGRHVEQLDFLDVLLGDRPPLTAAETFYQRMLANDPVEVAEQARESLKTMSLTAYFDEVIVPGLLLAQDDVSAGRLSVERQAMIRDATGDVIEDLGDFAEEAATPAGWRALLGSKQPDNDAQAPPSRSVAPEWAVEGAVLCIGARGPLDDSPASMLARLLRASGVGARAESYATLSKSAIAGMELASVRLICLSCLDGSSEAFLRFAIRRIRRHAPDATLLVGAWWRQTDAAGAVQTGAPERGSASDPFATTLLDAVHFCLAAASALTERHLIAPEAVATPLARPSGPEQAAPPRRSRSSA